MIAQPQLTRYHEKNRKRMETATGWLCTRVVSDREGEGERGREILSEEEEQMQQHQL